MPCWMNFTNQLDEVTATDLPVLFVDIKGRHHFHVFFWSTFDTSGQIKIVRQECMYTRNMYTHTYVYIYMHMYM